MTQLERLRITVTGIVQGVGFRPFVCGLADQLGVCGFVTNASGDVVIEAEARDEVIARFVELLHARRPANSRIDRMITANAVVTHSAAFEIAPSTEQAGAASIAPDLATCDACLAEITDRTQRRAGYAFASCASCGPRLTIVMAAPYDRERTTMAPFSMCEACRAEYDDPADRRHHAQPIACPACGPTLALDGDARDAIARAAAALIAGELLAIKGLGGYHLACDATNASAVQRLRTRKQRDAKPFAVMVRDVAMARELAELWPAELALLTSPARPIVLVKPHAETALAPEVSPGVADLGVLLPYTPLHHLLLAAVKRPLVMTSGNTSDEPIAYVDADARARLSPIADRFLDHDRAIHIRCEDSVARVVDGAPLLLRRARGFAPGALALPFEIREPILALGGHLKSVFALGAGERAYLSPHLGDLDHRAAYEAFVAQLAHQRALHRIDPVRVVHDLHPDYATTRLAEQLGLPRLAVQHHEAHFASAYVDAGLAGPAIGVCFDGAGLGRDGVVWGGELLVGDLVRIRRAAHLREVALPGGDRAAQEPWRMALSYLIAAGEPISTVIDRVGVRASHVAEMVGTPTISRTTSAGRLFDAVADLAGFGTMEFEGQAAMRLEHAARGSRDPDRYPIEFDLAGGVLDTLPIVRGVRRDLTRGVACENVARRFHTSLIELVAIACEALASREGIRDIVMSGGVFQNAIIALELPRRLKRAGLVPHVHRRVPPNDGGLAFGQLALAAHHHWSDRACV